MKQRNAWGGGTQIYNLQEIHKGGGEVKHRKAGREKHRYPINRKSKGRRRGEPQKHRK